MQLRAQVTLWLTEKELAALEAIAAKLNTSKAGALKALIATGGHVATIPVAVTKAATRSRGAVSPVAEAEAFVERTVAAKEGGEAAREWTESDEAFATKWERDNGERWAARPASGYGSKSTVGR